MCVHTYNILMVGNAEDIRTQEHAPGMSAPPGVVTAEEFAEKFAGLKAAKACLTIVIIIIILGPVITTIIFVAVIISITDIIIIIVIIIIVAIVIIIAMKVAKKDKRPKCTMKRPAAAAAVAQNIAKKVAKRPAAAVAQHSTELQLGCGKCRFSPKGCTQCRNPKFGGYRYNSSGLTLKI